MTRSASNAFLALGAALGAACGQPQSERPFDLHRNLLLAERVQVVVADGPAGEAAHYRSVTKTFDKNARLSPLC